MYHNEKTPEEKKANYLTAIAFEHKKAIEFLSITNGDVEAYKTKSIQPLEMEKMNELMAKNPTIPTLDQQKGRAVKELKNLEEFQAEKKKDTPVIDQQIQQTLLIILENILLPVNLKPNLLRIKTVKKQYRKQFHRMSRMKWTKTISITFRLLVLNVQNVANLF